jgi:hypothetical protein
VRLQLISDRRASLPISRHLQDLVERLHRRLEQDARPAFAVQLPPTVARIPDRDKRLLNTPI